MATGFSATSTASVQNAKKDLQRFLKSLDRVPKNILKKEAKILYGEIIEEVPYDTGKLANSVRVSVSQDKRRPGLNASASALSKRHYNYAGIQHEDPDFEHIFGKYHYISDPFIRCIKRIKKQVRERLKVKGKK